MIEANLGGGGGVLKRTLSHVGIRNFWELKELVLTQCKETKNFEKRFDEMLKRIDNIERNTNELMELKNTT